MNLSNLLKDPIDIPFLLVYVTGVLVMVYSAMQFVHGAIYKEKKSLIHGIKTFLLALLLLAPRLIYQRVRVDGSDYLKLIKTSIEATGIINNASATYDEQVEKLQLEALAERLSEDGYHIDHLTGSADNDSINGFQLLSAVKTTLSDAESADIILISAYLDAADEVASFFDTSKIAILESVAKKLSYMETSAEVRFLISRDARQGRDMAEEYISSLSADEKKRIIFELSFEISNSDEYPNYGAATVNGRSTSVSDALISSIRKMTGQKVNLQISTDTEYVVYHVNDIPSVLLIRNLTEESSTKKAGVQAEKLSDSAAIIGNILTNAVSKNRTAFSDSIRSMDKDVVGSGSFVKKAYPKSLSVMDISEDLGVKLTEIGKKDSAGAVIYSGRLYLLTFDSPSEVLFHINDEGLKKISLNTKELSRSKEEITQILKNLFGEPETEDGVLIWTDEEYSSKYHLTESDTSDTFENSVSDGYTLYITSIDN